MRKTLILVLFSVIGIFCQTFDLLPTNKLYQVYYADALSHQFSLIKNTRNKEWYGNVGISVPLFNIGYQNNNLQVSAASTIFNTVIKTPGHIQVYTVDYLVDFFFDYNLHKNIPLRFIFGHQSSHFADDGITELGNYPISYVRDYVGMHSMFSAKDFKIYAGMYYNFHIEPEMNKKFNFQFGGDKFFMIFEGVNIYGALDLKFKSEVNYLPTQSYQAGLQFLGQRDVFSIRAAYTFRSGYDERGQLYNIKDSKHMLGVYLDFL